MAEEPLSIFTAHKEDSGDLGQDADTPPATEDVKGQGPEDTPPGDDKDKGASVEDTPTSDEVKDPDKEDKDKPPPYDQDPKWKAARKAEAKLDKLAKKHGFEDHDALLEAFEEGQDMRDVLGKRDLAELIRDSRRLVDFEAEHGTLDEIANMLADMPDGMEDDDQETKQLKKENLELKRQMETEEKSRQKKAYNDKIMSDYETSVKAIIEDADLPEEQLELVNLIHGLDNPAMKVELENAVAVKKMARSLVRQTKGIIDKIRQNAIDEYATGKSQLIPKTEKKEEKPERRIEEQPKERRVYKQSHVDDAFDEMEKDFASVVDRMAM